MPSVVVVERHEARTSTLASPERVNNLSLTAKGHCVVVHPARDLDIVAWGAESFQMVEVFVSNAMCVHVVVVV